MIIGIKDEGKVTLAYSLMDELTTLNTCDMLNEVNAGVWKVKRNPHTIMGCMFPSAESDAYRYENELFAGKIDFDTLCLDIVPAMEEFAKDKDYIGDEKDGFENLLIAQDDRLYRITSEHIVVEIDDYVVLSYSGEDMAKVVLHQTRGEPAIDRIKKTLEFIAAQRQCACYPIVVMDTASRKLRQLHSNKR